MPPSRRVAIVTGASRGIGRATAIRLAKDGYNVVINYHSNASSAQEVINTIQSSCPDVRAIAVQADMGQIPDGEKLLDATLAAFGRIDAVVFNAGWVNGSEFEGLEGEDFDAAFRINVKAPVFFTKLLIPHLQPGSRLIFISSGMTTSSRISSRFLLYTASKGAVNQIVRSLCKDLGPKGITINGVSPGIVDTETLRREQTPEVIQWAAGLSAFGRLGMPDDVADVVSFFASEDSRWVTGQMLEVNGGSDF
ncbi:hypothetical protein DFQ27_004479 [Actinomortierella ambigua]|uniref:Uncharacterized protein n=1 Tax=Actinomortierella ambigua TaxID=1343610 RepID=A0A9P6U4E5_9FUNG|nr:hypothetical protein DFQ27_004479 [Actinomortierella ambigua]